MREKEKHMELKINDTYFGYNLGQAIRMYLLMVIAKTVKRETATRAYLAIGNMRQRVLPCVHDWCQKVEAASGRLKQQNRRSDRDRLIMNIAVAFRTCKIHTYKSYNTVIQ